MTTIAVSASLQRACSSNNVTKKQQSQIRTARSIGTKQKSNVVTLNVEGDVVGQQEKSSFQMGRYLEHSSETESPAPKFLDERWKNGTWDLNMFVQDGKMDWDGLIVAGECLIIQHYNLTQFDFKSVDLLQKQEGEVFLKFIQNQQQMKNQ